MAIIYYTGIDKDGETFRRFDDVMDIREIYEAVAKNDEEIIQLVKLPEFTSGISWKAKRLKEKEVAEFCHQLSMYLEGGVDLYNVFQEIQKEPISRNMHKVVSKITNSLAEGFTLSAALKNTRALPEIMVTLIEIGENSGNIAQAFKDAAEYIERSLELRSSTKRAMIYPAFTLTIMLVGIVFWTVFVIPQVVKVIQTLDSELPIQTQILLAVSDFLKEYWAYELGAIVGVFLAYVIARQHPRFKFYQDKLWWKFPILKTAVQSSQMAFYFNYFRVLYNAGVPISDILEKLQQSIPNDYFKQAVKISNEAIKEGETLQRGYKKANVFDGLAVRIIGVGEQSGTLHKQLELLSKIYSKRIQQFVEQLPKVLEPVFIVIIGLFFVLFASMLLGPLYEVIINISGGA